VIATFVLVFVAGADFLKSVFGEWPCRRAWPILGGKLGSGASAFLGGSTGYAINLRRDFGPRLAHAILADCGQGRFQTGLRADSDCRSLAGGALAGCSETFVDLTVSLSDSATCFLLTDFSSRWEIVMSLSGRFSAAASKCWFARSMPR